MIASGSQSSMQSNSRSSSRSRASGVLQWCGCGCRPVLRWSTTEANPNNPFFGCPNYNVNANIGEEDLRGRVMSTMDGDQVRVDLAWRIGKIEAESTAINSGHKTKSIIYKKLPSFIQNRQKQDQPVVGTNFRKLASLEDVAELAPCSGSTVIDPDGGVEDLLLVCNLDGLAAPGFVGSVVLGGEVLCIGSVFLVNGVSSAGVVGLLAWFGVSSCRGSLSASSLTSLKSSWSPSTYSTISFPSRISGVVTACSK
ncbi:hypothetical protein Ahy_B08g089042 [Arachis hypogaea]|uniref:Uncharacterized protein n=1 Tax=Arachis hypogaea TaxID=3818 RepID=A0A444XWM6_ARAHY|nr:hypothetical protein Ahy_B08g089042 [Arachis hypogaea]